jgi:hypothetical protein
MGVEPQPFRKQQPTQNQLDLAKIMGAKTRPFKN